MREHNDKNSRFYADYEESPVSCLQLQHGIYRKFNRHSKIGLYNLTTFRFLFISLFSGIVRVLLLPATHSQSLEFLRNTNQPRPHGANRGLVILSICLSANMYLRPYPWPPAFRVQFDNAELILTWTFSDSTPRHRARRVNQSSRSHWILPECNALAPSWCIWTRKREENKITCPSRRSVVAWVCLSVSVCQRRRGTDAWRCGRPGEVTMLIAAAVLGSSSLLHKQSHHTLSHKALQLFRGLYPFILRPSYTNCTGDWPPLRLHRIHKTAAQGKCAYDDDRIERNRRQRFHRLNSSTCFLWS